MYRYRPTTVIQLACNLHTDIIFGKRQSWGHLYWGQLETYFVKSSVVDPLRTCHAVIWNPENSCLFDFSRKHLPQELKRSDLFHFGMRKTIDALFDCHCMKITKRMQRILTWVIIVWAFQVWWFKSFWDLMVTLMIKINMCLHYVFTVRFTVRAVRIAGFPWN